MKRIFAFASLAAFLLATSATANECMRSDADEEIAEGQLEVGHFQDAAGRPESSYILTLPVPTCLDANDPELSVGPTSTIHIYSSDETVHAQIQPFAGKTVLVRGRPFGAHTAHHHAPIVMDITEIDEQ